MTARINRFFQKTWVKVIVAVLIPLVGCGLYMIKNGVGIGQYSIFCSGWNDELSYYKHVEGMLKYGVPQGYFGFNESTARIGTFGAWNPASMIPFYVVGKVFGWNYNTPMIFNMVLNCLIFAVFALVLKPNYKQLIISGVIWTAFSCNSRYIFSGTPESYITFLVFLFFVCLIKYIREQSKASIIVCNIAMIFLTLIRGYYVAFGLILLYVLTSNRMQKDGLLENAEAKETQKSFKNAMKALTYKDAIMQIIVMIASAIAFALQKHFFAAEYFTDIVNTESLLNPKHAIKLILLSGKETLEYMVSALTRDSMRGTWYIVFFFVIGMLLYLHKESKNKKQDLRQDIKENQRNSIHNNAAGATLSGLERIYLVIIAVGIMLVTAMWLLYNAKEGSRHLMACAIVGIMLVNYLIDKRTVAIISILIVLYLSWFSKDDFYNKIYPLNEDQVASYEVEQKRLTELMPISENKWDNTAIYTLSMAFDDLYALPAGMGISDCDDSYVMENLDGLKSKYVCTRIGEEVDDFMMNSDAELIETFANTRIYKLR
ncbi:hypothetical protein SAMN02910298_01920 [Pseudobutyrivibrio sp. YE44]|uniref:hypothetical protein n=1 Tax=Pseudobutyrivibrio sp. YE44 TaxID=1520802 RepID=UPI00087E2E2E|nr:hypothetical protein [Pseudobutyrivibrio sp. YE44]SDB38942.1 hypothetical protein SAMN02910298_01920 [Pseudobutyrivibrio sp. YE44]